MYSIRSIVCLNLPSFSGGLDPWGKPNRKKLQYVSFDCSLICFRHIGSLLNFNLKVEMCLINKINEIFQMLCALQRDLTPPYVDDGLLEIVGFRNAWHGLALLAPKGHGTRLAQV